MNTAVILSPACDLSPAPLYAATPKAKRRVAEFFTTQINNDHTRKAYLNAARRFSAWCEEHGIQELSVIEPIHIAAFVKSLEKEFSAPTVKQHLAALRILFDWLVTGHVLERIRHTRSAARNTLCARGKPPCSRQKRSGIYSIRSKRKR